jgi:hypothetical protein
MLRRTMAPVSHENLESCSPPPLDQSEMVTGRSFPTITVIENAPVITGLLDKRASIESEIAELELEIRRRRSEVMQIDAATLLFASGQAGREPVPASAHFIGGEPPRRCQTGFREAKGRPVTADEIAVQAMKEKNLDMGDGALRQDITRRFMWTLTRMLKTGGCHQAGVGMRGWGCR